MELYSFPYEYKLMLNLRKSRAYEIRPLFTDVIVAVKVRLVALRSSKWGFAC